MRRWNRPILSDIIEKGLDPKKNYNKLDKSGNLIDHDLPLRHKNAVKEDVPVVKITTKNQEEEVVVEVQKEEVKTVDQPTIPEEVVEVLTTETLEKKDEIVEKKDEPTVSFQQEKNKKKQKKQLPTT